MPGRWREELPGTAWRWLFAPAWAGYATVVALRNAAYDCGAFATHDVSVPVFAVGNLVAGGAGKTPAALALARNLVARGRRPAVVSRGYRGDGNANDEALLAPDLPMVCDPDRVRGARKAIAAGADCLVLDDGFQHRRLRRNLDLVVIDATRPWGDPNGGRGAMLPLGWRREPISALRRAQVAWISRGHLALARADALAAELSGMGLTVVREATPTRTLVTLAGEPTTMPAGRVLLASGIGNPLGFELDAQDLGWSVAASLRFSDHHPYTPADVTAITGRATALGVNAVVVTAKDAVKLAGLWPAHALPCFVLRAVTTLRPEDTAVLALAVDRVLA
ncbi:MAG: tetraacyldisaccharide 4'-kinase [Planctomycetota bacterium]